MKTKKTFYVSAEISKTMDDMYMYFMQQGKKRTYSDLFADAIKLLNEKLITEKNKSNKLI